MRTAMTLFALLLCSLAIPCAADPPKASESAHARDLHALVPPKMPDQVLMYTVQSTPARDIANTMSQLFRDRKEVLFAADSTNNMLIVRGPRESVNAAAEILKRLDPPKRLVSVELFLVEATGNGPIPRERLSGPLPDVNAALKEMQAQKGIVVRDQFQISTLSDQSAKLHVGRRASMVTGTSMGPRGKMHAYSHVEVGTMVALTPRVSDSQILIEMDFEKSDIDSPPQANDEETIPPEIVTTSYSSTVAVQPGHAMIVEDAHQNGNGSATSGSFLILAADVVVVGQPTAPARRAANTGRRSAPSTARPVPSTRQPSLTSADRKPTLVPPKEKPSAARSPFPSGSLNERYLKYAEALLKRYDLNKDGKLNEEERSKMTRPVQNIKQVDRDGDGQLDAGELGNYLNVGKP